MLKSLIKLIVNRNRMQPIWNDWVKVRDNPVAHMVVSHHINRSILLSHLPYSVVSQSDNSIQFMLGGIMVTFNREGIRI